MLVLDNALKLLNKIEENGFKAYIVGGFVRDHVLGIESNDVDICTNARPKDIHNIFKDACLPNEDYGSVTVIVKNIRYEITTFRREYSYVGNRKPGKFEFIDDLHEDLKRRDFLINTLCIDCYGNVLDIMNGQKDLKDGVINTVGDSYQKFEEDALRILRAVRFATNLKFKLSDDVKNSILKTKHLLKKLSYERKREELDKIFTSVNVLYGVNLLLDLGLDVELELKELNNVKNFDDLVGVWAQLMVKDGTYRFTANEKELIKKIQLVMDMDNLSPGVLYRYGLYVNSVVAGIKKIDKKIVTRLYNELPIKSKSDIKINGDDICQLLGREPGKYLRQIMSDIEEKILTSELKNEKEILLDYVSNNY